MYTCTKSKSISWRGFYIRVGLGFDCAFEESQFLLALVAISSAVSGPIIDIHTHIYPSYLSFLRACKTVPYLLDFPAPAISRLIILPSDDDESLPSSSRGQLALNPPL